MPAALLLWIGGILLIGLGALLRRDTFDLKLAEESAADLEAQLSHLKSAG